MTDSLNKEKNSPVFRDSNKTRKIIRRGLSYLFSFLLSLTILALGTSGIIRIVLSEPFLENCLSDDYYDSLSQDLESKALDYTIPTGLDPSVVENVFDSETVKKDVDEYIKSTFKIRKYTTNTDGLETKIRDNVYAFLSSQGTPTELVNAEDSEIELDENSVQEYNAAVNETKAAVDEYISDIMEIYRRDIKPAGLDYLAKAGNEYQKYFPYIFVILILLSTLFVFLSMRLHKLPHRGLRFLVYAFSGGFLMTFLAPFVVYLTGFYNRLNITPEYFKNFMVDYVKATLALFMVISQAWLLIAIILGVVVMLLRKKRLKSAESSREKHKAEKLLEEQFEEL